MILYKYEGTEVIRSQKWFYFLPWWVAKVGTGRNEKQAFTEHLLPGVHLSTLYVITLNPYIN